MCIRDRRRLLGNRAPDLKPSTTPDLQVAGLQERATTPGRFCTQQNSYFTLQKYILYSDMRFVKCVG